MSCLVLYGSTQGQLLLFLNRSSFSAPRGSGVGTTCVGKQVCWQLCEPEGGNQPPASETNELRVWDYDLFCKKGFLVINRLHLLGPRWSFCIPQAPIAFMIITKFIPFLAPDPLWNWVCSSQKADYIWSPCFQSTNMIHFFLGGVGILRDHT